ncbi:HNH endonuclease [Nocardia halotolerans]|uniref:HNH endonuclease n=1 Tax=Nocardia halotolerans TaxID=1755878 RepID=A0ABV8VBG8_9NOCA
MAVSRPVRQHRKKVPTAVRLAVYVRDDWTCQYCHRRIDPTTPKQERGAHAPAVHVKGYGLMWLELDHIGPYSGGGEHTVDNLRAACSPCNRSKSDSTTEADWANRTRLALQLLNDNPPSRATAQAAARALTGSPLRLDNRGDLETN